MKLFTSMLLVTVALGTSSAGQDMRVRDEVVEVQRRFFDAYRACDAATVERLTMEDVVYFHSSGLLQTNRAQLVKSLGGGCGFDVLSFDVAQVRVHGDTAVIY